MISRSRRRHRPFIALAALLIAATAAVPAEANVTLPGLNERLGFSSFRDFPADAPYNGTAPKGEEVACGETDNPDSSTDPGGGRRCGEELYTVFPDGTQETRITNNSRKDAKFSWSPLIGGGFAFETRRNCDTSYASLDRGCQADIFSSTDPPTQLTNWFGSDTHPSYSPDATRIAFESDRVQEKQEEQENAGLQGSDTLPQARAIYTMSSTGEFAGGAATQLTPLPTDELPENVLFAEVEDVTPAWSPDGTQIAFTRRFFGIGFIGLPIGEGEVEDARKLVRRVKDGEISVDEAQRQLAPGLVFGLSMQTYIAPAGGGEPEPLGEEQTACIFPILLGEPAGDEECFFDRHPAWTPDGSRILVDRLPAFSFFKFLSEREGIGGIFPHDRDIVSISVSNPEDVVNLSDATEDQDACDRAFIDGEVGCDEDAKPAPSPDGTRVAFHSDRACPVGDEARNNPDQQLNNMPSTCFDIWTMNMDGTNAQRVTSNPHADWNADWRRTENPPVVTAAPPPAAPKAPARPTARIAGVRARGCTASRRMRVPIRVTAEAGVRSVRVSLDGRRIKTSRKSRFTVFVNANRLKPGRHRISVTVIDNAGQRRTTTRRFSRCAQARRRAAPRFTG